MTIMNWKRVHEEDQLRATPRRPSEWYQLKAKYGGTCARCNEHIYAGDEIVRRVRVGTLLHLRCAKGRVRIG